MPLDLVTVCDPWVEPGALSCAPTGEGQPDEVWTAQATQACAAATELLYLLSGQQFGVCERTFRPGRPLPDHLLVFGEPATPSGTHPWVWGAGWTWPGCGSLRLTLPAPLVAVGEVRVPDPTTGDPVVLDPSAYRVDDWRVLVRLDGNRWPELDVWDLDVTLGRAVPAAGLLAVDELACELLLAIRGDAKCRLGRRVTEVARKGVTRSAVLLDTLLDKSRLGLELCDLFLTAYNPTGVRSGARVYRIDQPSPTVAGT